MIYVKYHHSISSFDLNLFKLNPGWIQQLGWSPINHRPAHLPLVWLVSSNSDEGFTKWPQGQMAPLLQSHATGEVKLKSGTLTCTSREMYQCAASTQPTAAVIGLSVPLLLFNWFLLTGSQGHVEPQQPLSKRQKHTPDNAPAPAQGTV